MNYIKIVLLKLKNSFLRDWEYKTNFVSGVLVQLAYAFVILMFLYTIYNYTDLIAGLNFAEIAIYAFFFDASLQIMYFIIAGVNWKISSGMLVNYLTKPVSEFVFYLNFGMINLIICLTSILIIIGIILIEGVKISIINLILSIISFIIATPLLILPLLTISSLAFWFTEIGSLLEAYFALNFSFDQFPVVVIKGLLLGLFFIIIPSSYFSIYFPVAILLGKTNLVFALQIIAITIGIDLIMFGIFRIIYKKGLKQYEGFGG